jgi:hypothetical protein
VQPAKQRFHEDQEQQGVETVTLERSPVYVDFSGKSRWQNKAWLGVRVKVFDDLNAVQGEPKVMHVDEQLIMVNGVECRAESRKRKYVFLPSVLASAKMPCTI